MALIELSPETPARPDPVPGPPPAWVYRRAGLLLALVLALVLGGAAPAQARYWQHAGTLSLGESADVVLGGGRIYAVDPTARPPVITAWSAADPARELWRVTGPANSGQGRYGLTPGPGDLLLLDVRRTTTVLDARTGAQLWRSPTPLQLIGDGDGLRIEEQFRPGTAYDPESGEPGKLYGTTSDVLHTEPARSTVLHGLDPATGRPRWSATVPGSVSTMVTGSALVVLSADRLTVRDPASGAVRHERALPPVDGTGPAWGELSGGTVLVHYGAFGEGGWVAAYDAGTLEPRWSRDQPGTVDAAVDCTGLPCTRTRREVTVVDPLTGRGLWDLPSSRPVDLVAFGADHVLWNHDGAVRMMLDRRTGVPGLFLTGWTAAEPARGGGRYLLSRATAGGDTELALLWPGAPEELILGEIPGAVTGCRLDVAYVACRAEGRVEVYRYPG